MSFICSEAMKYIGEPHCTVIDYYNNKKVFQFDEKGEFITEDEKLIKWMKENKNFIKCENDSYKCKKCDFETDNMGLLLSHYRTDHPKGVE